MVRTTCKCIETYLHMIFYFHQGQHAAVGIYILLVDRIHCMIRTSASSTKNQKPVHVEVVLTPDTTASNSPCLIVITR